MLSALALPAMAIAASEADAALGVMSLAAMPKLLTASKVIPDNAITARTISDY